MRLSILLLTLFFFSRSLFAQQHTSCCEAHENQSFEMFARDPSFAMAHAEPLPFPDPASIQGTNIGFSCSDGKNGTGFLVKNDDTSKILLLFHEWWGVNDYIKNEAMKLSKELGVTVVALDLYDGNVASTREQAAQYVQTLKRARAIAIIEGAYNFFGADKHYATIGWCMGGSWSMQAALAGMNRRLVGCVIYYGMPEREPEVIELLNCPVLGIFAKKDKFITLQIVTEAKNAFRKAKKTLHVHSYDADHGFANPSNPNYDMKNAEKANVQALAFLKKQFSRKNK